MKVCTKCGGDPKPLTEFSNDASRRDGLQAWCKSCSRVVSAAYRAANPERVKAVYAKWNAANTGKEMVRKAAWRASNPEKVKAADATYHAGHREKRKAIKTKWDKANPEVCRIHKQNRRARKCANGGRLSPGLAARLFKLQQGKCACCHVSLDDGNHLDHVMPVALGGPNEDWNMQLLCPPCNLQKHAKHPIEFMQQRGFLL